MCAPRRPSRYGSQPGMRGQFLKGCSPRHDNFIIDELLCHALSVHPKTLREQLGDLSGWASRLCNTDGSRRQRPAAFSHFLPQHPGKCIDQQGCVRVKIESCASIFATNPGRQGDSDLFQISASHPEVRRSSQQRPRPGSKTSPRLRD